MVIRVLTIVALLGGSAVADSPKLAQAREAVAKVRYDAAQTLLVDALKDGGNSPAAVSEIYRLSATTAVVLDRKDLAEQYYRRWLALDPDAALPDDISPKIRAPFVEAQAYMNAHGRLVAKVARTADGVDVVVETDPLGMAVAVALDGGPATKLGAERRASLDGHGTTAAVLDEYGNRLVELVVPAETVTVTTPDVPEQLPARAAVPLYRKGKVWVLAAGIALGGGIAFGYLARDAHKDVQAIAADSTNHTLGDYNDARDRRDRYALLSTTMFAVGGVLAATAVVMFVIQPTEAMVVPVATGNSAGVTVIRSF